MDTIYLLRDQIGKYKIGFTKHNTEKRIKSLQTGNSGDLEIIYEFKTNHKRKLETSLHFQSQLSTSAGLNSFLLTLNPAESTNSEKNGMFGNYTVMSNENSTYLVVVNIYKNIGAGVEKSESIDSYPYDDNQFCSEGDIVFTSKANIVGSALNDASQSKDDQNAQPVSCGTIDIDNGPGSGGNAVLSFAIGLIIVFFAPVILRKSNEIFV